MSDDILNGDDVRVHAVYKTRPQHSSDPVYGWIWRALAPNENEERESCNGAIAKVVDIEHGDVVVVAFYDFKRKCGTTLFAHIDDLEPFERDGRWYDELLTVPDVGCEWV